MSLANLVKINQLQVHNPSRDAMRRLLQAAHEILLMRTLPR